MTSFVSESLDANGDVVWPMMPAPVLKTGGQIAVCNKEQLGIESSFGVCEILRVAEKENFVPPQGVHPLEKSRIIQGLFLFFTLKNPGMEFIETRIFIENDALDNCRPIDNQLIVKFSQAYIFDFINVI